MCKNPIKETISGPGNVILSRPHSGNHLLRAVIEIHTGRPTLGVVSNASNDPPILGRFGYEYQEKSPVAVKAHQPSDILEGLGTETLKTVSPVAGLVFIGRNPHARITSVSERFIWPIRWGMATRNYRWIVRRLVKPYRRRSDLEWSVRRELSELQDAAQTFLDWTGPRLFIRYEDLLIDKSDSWQRLAQFFGYKDDPGKRRAAAQLSRSARKTSLKRTSRPGSAVSKTVTDRVACELKNFEPSPAKDFVMSLLAN